MIDLWLVTVIVTALTAAETALGLYGPDRGPFVVTMPGLAVVLLLGLAAVLLGGGSS